MNIRNTISMQDRITPVFRSMIRSMDQTINAMQRVNQSANRNVTDRSFRSAQRSINQASNELTRFQNHLTRSNQEANRLNNTTRNMSSGMSLLNVSAGISLAQQFASLVNSSSAYLDDMASTKARIDLINDGLQTTGELQDKILASANRARMGYGDMSKAVTKLNMLASDQFKSNDEAIFFVETLNKMFAVSGTGAQEATAAMYQLTQAMGAGKLQGDEFRSIMENAPMLADAIAKAMGKSKAELKELSSDGLITAEVIKQAMVKSADEINKKFDTLPMTFSQKMTVVKNNFMKNMEPVAQKFSEWLNSDDGNNFFSTLSNGLVMLSNVALIVLTGISKAFTFISDNIQYLMPFVVALGTLLVGKALIATSAWFLANGPFIALAGVIGLAIGILSQFGLTFENVVNFMSSAIEYLMPLLMAVGIVAFGLWIKQLWAITYALFGVALGWLAAHWPILIVIAAIALVIFIMQQFGVTVGDVVGFVIGSFYALWAMLSNMFIDLINIFMIFGTFLYNVFTDPIAAIKMLFLDMATYIVDKVLWVAQSIQDLVNMIPFVEVDITSGLENIKANIETTKNEIAAESGIKKSEQIGYKNPVDSFKNGFDKGKGFVNNFGKNGIGSKMKGPSKPTMPSMGIPKGMGSGKGLGDGKLKGGKLDKVGKIDDEIKITDEDIKLLKDISKAEFINKYTTLQPNMKVEFTGDIKETADVNKIVETIENMVEEALASSLVG
ncbi:MAG: tape measure protein [Clostridium sp.]